MIAIHHVFTRFDLRAEQADIPDVMLRTGMMAAGEVNVDGGVEREAGVEIIGDFQTVFFGVGVGEFAAGAARAGHQRAAHAAGRPVQTDCFQLFLDRLNVGCGNIADEQVLPDGETDRTAAVPVGNIGQLPQLLAGHPPDRQHHPDVIQPRLFLHMKADMTVGHHFRPWLTIGQGKPAELAAQMLFSLFDEPIEAMLVEHIFKPGFFAIRAVAVIDENPHDRRGDGDAFIF